MQLLGCTSRPLRGPVGIDALKRQLYAHFVKMHLGPCRVRCHDATVEELAVETGQSDRVGTVEDNRAETDTGHTPRLPAYMPAASCRRE